ncbi:hypothetical protein [Methanosphaera sp. WGK6]|uniref:hypothetical protein n=1 Tax=Methanosphaera sp. WGK6 TaxID=1561964 RepID=UPI000A018522|nr:hypothetical protein [Methanosphaera sp. WGK6]
MLKINSHDGPARLGQWKERITPTVIDYKEIEIVKNIATPFKIQKEIAQEYTQQTINLAQEEKNKKK